MMSYNMNDVLKGDVAVGYDVVSWLALMGYLLHVEYDLQNFVEILFMLNGLGVQ